MDPVTSVLLSRRREPGSIRKMLTVSTVLHAAAAVVLVAWTLLSASANSTNQPQTVMTISLGGGAPGPVTGGRNPMGGRPVQTTEPAKKPEAVRPPAERKPAMTLPVPKGTPVPKTAPKTDVEEGRGQTPARGTEIKPGSTFGETGGEGTGFGLTMGGEGGQGDYVDVGNFCCPEYLTTMIGRIQRNWVANQGTAGDVVIQYTVRRDGRIVDVSVAKPSGLWVLDSAAQRAVVTTGALPPLPAAVNANQLTFQLTFHYRR